MPAQSDVPALPRWLILESQRSSGVIFGARPDFDEFSKQSRWRLSFSLESRPG